MVGGTYQKQRKNLDIHGLLSSIYDAAVYIDTGRKYFAIEGKEREGRISYETGIDKALTAFKEAQISAEPQTLILAEYTFLSQELQLCEENDKDSIDSLTAAVQSFDDAFLVLQVVGNSIFYKEIDKAFPHHKKYRIKTYPKDSYHTACIAHRTRLKNILRAPGIDPLRTAFAFEKALLKQRLANLSTAQNGYVEKQKKAMAN